jgi:hypothetical protein
MTSPILLPNGLHAIHQAGEFRVLAALKPRLYCGLPTFADRFQTIPAAKLEDCSLEPFGCPVLDQGSTSSCVGHSSATAFLRSWLLSGQPAHEFNPFWIYGLINGGEDNGAVISDALVAMKQYGVATVGAVTGGDLPRQLVYPSQLRSLPDVFAKASRFKVAGAWKLTSFEDICTALTLRMVCVSGIAVGQNFGDLDGEACAPLPDRILGGHALEHHGLKWSASKKEWLIRTQNSWTAQWGDKGMCYLRKAHYQNMQFDAYALVTVLDDSADATTDPPVAA